MAVEHGFTVAGGQEDARLGTGRPEVPAYLAATHSRHDRINNDEVDRPVVRFGCSDSLAAAARRQYLVSPAKQQVLDQLPQVFVVLNDENRLGAFERALTLLRDTLRRPGP